MLYDVRIIERKVVEYQIEAGSPEEAEEIYMDGGQPVAAEWPIDSEGPFVLEHDPAATR